VSLIDLEFSCGEIRLTRPLVIQLIDTLPLSVKKVSGYVPAPSRHVLARMTRMMSLIGIPVLGHAGANFFDLGF
jgi:hypothetical protein